MKNLNYKLYYSKFGENRKKKQIKSKQGKIEKTEQNKMNYN